MISVNSFKDFTDNIAGQYILLDSVMGDGTKPNTASYGAELNLKRVLNLDVYDAEADLLKAAKSNAENVKSTNIYKFFSEIIRALNFHVNGIDTYLTVKGIRVAPEFKILYEQIMGVKLTWKNTFAPETNMGNFTFIGPSSGNFQDGDAIDITKHNVQRLTLKVLTDFTTSAVISVFCTKIGGTIEIKEVEIPENTIEGTEFNIGGVNDVYYDVTNITAIGGDAQYSLKVFARREREPKFD